MKERMFTTISSFVEHRHELNEETESSELAEFSSIDRQNIQATEFIAYWAYPSGRFKKDNLKSMLVAFGQTYYPIAGWSPDTSMTSDEDGKKETVIRKTLKRLKKRTFFNPRENKRYILYG